MSRGIHIDAPQADRACGETDVVTGGLSASPMLREEVLPLARISTARSFFAWRYREPTLAETADLAESLRAAGLVHPLIVRRRGKSFEVVCGHRRLAAIRRLAREDSRWKRVPCRVAEGLTDDRLLRISLDENAKRKSPTALETALTVDRLARERGRSYREIGALLGIPVKKVQRYRRILKGSRR